eukprot:TRINITY_DN11874_c0_g3_i2.p1 TRINITY_DN11874_c0_g3~~TRINITY_DN11874_c0_g3_i2.p1  ORF type:complete len:153 (-),score=27.62 TRINITY_DN11874_c0_g3_i2:143-577(-)
MCIRDSLRVLLKDSHIICLDEATSNMDPRTDAEFHKALFAYVEEKKKTLLVITHRLENIENYDRVLVMDKGEIMEQGPPRQLMSKRDGFFGPLNHRKKQKVQMPCYMILQFYSILEYSTQNAFYATSFYANFSFMGILFQNLSS